jgi:hypothetical protein
MLKFAQTYPNVATWPHLTWSHYRELMIVDDKTLRGRFTTLAHDESWSVARLRDELAKWKKDTSKQKRKSQCPMRCSKNRRSASQRFVTLTGSSHEAEASKKMIDFVFGIYLKLSQTHRSRFERGDTVTWSNQKRRWIKSGTKHALYFYTAVLERVVDGDTLLVHIDLEFHFRVQQYLRLSGIDAMKLKTPQGKQAAACFYLTEVDVLRAPPSQF